MSENRMPYEETIDLKDVCVYILRKWKALLLAVLVGAVLLGGYKAVSGPDVVSDSARIKEIEAQVKENQALIKTKQADLTNVDKEIATDASNITKAEESIDTKEKEIRTQTITLENLKRIVEGYESNLQEAESLLQRELLQEVEIELVTRISSLRMNVLNNSNQILAVEQKIDNLELDIVTLEEKLVAYEAELAKDKDCKKTINDSIVALNEENAALAEEDTNIIIPVTMKDIVKFVIFGAVAGGFVVCGVAFLQYFMDKKLRRVDELKERYGMRVLGDFFVPAVKTNKIDLLLDRMEGYQGQMDAEKEAALVAAKVQVLAPAAGEVNQVIVTGTVEKSMLDQMAHRIAANMPATGYEVCVVQNPVYDAEALLKIHQGIVVLVEGKGVSVKKEIAALVEILQDAKAQVLGVVLQ